jgi:hypothetical protein
MNYSKKQLLEIAKKVTNCEALTPNEVKYLLEYQTEEKEHGFITWLKDWAVPLSLAFGFSLATFSRVLDPLIEQLPGWTNLSPELLAGVDYLWSILSNPIEKQNIVYHLPNLVLYSFGIVGIKSLLERLERKTWLDKVLDAQEILKVRVKNGEQNWQMKKGHSLLFVGKGDFIAEQFIEDHDADEVVTIAETQQSFTEVWSQYNVNSVYDSLKTVVERSSGKTAGEYLFFPVKDLSLFLPNEKDYDLSPYKLDILCQNIRSMEREKKWKIKPIIIIGDKFHSSFVQSEDQKKIIPKSEEEISLLSISQRYPSIQLLDPTDIVLQKIIEIANGREIVFRATREGLAEYKQRFYKRLHLLGYKPVKKKILTIGYDLFEDQTEQQTLSKKVQDYYPVVLSASVRDALLRNGYKKDQFLYVPELVLQTITQSADKQ